MHFWIMNKGLKADVHHQPAVHVLGFFAFSPFKIRPKRQGFIEIHNRHAHPFGDIVFSELFVKLFVAFFMAFKVRAFF